VEASIKRKGLLCEGLYYTCDLARREEWFERATETACKKVKLARDPRNLSKAYLRLDGGRRMEVCELVEADHTFFGKDWYELAEESEVRKQRADNAKYSGIDHSAELNAYADAVIALAEEKTKDQRQDMSDRARVGDIRKNRDLEKTLEREANAWVLGDEACNEPISLETDPQMTASSSRSGYVPPAQPMDKLRQARAERI
jgi:hypothetical protein